MRGCLKSGLLGKGGVWLALSLALERKKFMVSKRKWLVVSVASAVALLAAPASAMACPGDGGPAPTVIKDHFCGTWNAAEARGFHMGSPANDAHRWGNGWVRDFRLSSTFGSGVIMEGDGVGFAYIVGNPAGQWYWDAFKASGNVVSLGYPVGRHEFGGHLNQGPRANLYMTFQGGVVNAWAGGTFGTHGGIHRKWSATGHVAGSVGRPLSNEYRTAARNGAAQRFEGGYITHNPRLPGEFVTYNGPLLNKYIATGSSSGILGLPTTDPQYNAARGNSYQVFDGGVINQYGGNAFETHGAILSRWQRGGGPNGPLGLPTSDEQEAARSPQGTTGRYSRFQTGLVNYSRWGTFVLFGSIGAKYASLGYSGSYLGFPTSEEYNFNGGKRQNFEGGYIFWRAGYRPVTNRDDGSDAFREKPDEGRDGPGANGCGPGGRGVTAKILAKAIPDRSLTFDFREACNRHDRCYRWRGAERLQCDQAFLSRMRASCNRYKIRRNSCLGWATFYYKVVRKRGEGPFRNAQRNAR